MKKLLMLFYLIVFLSSCEPNRQRNHNKKVEINYSIQVDFLDGVRDTLCFKTDEVNIEPYLKSDSGISMLVIGWENKASYVKTFKVLSKEYDEIN